MLIEAVNPATLAWGIPASLLLLYWLNYLWFVYRISRSAGVRAPSVGDNPITCTQIT